MLNASLSDYFPDEDYRFHLRLGQQPPAEFFAPTADHRTLIDQRAGRLRVPDRRYSACDPEGVSLLREVLDLAASWNHVPAGLSALAERDPGEACRALGRLWESDFLLLKARADGEMMLHCGCVCGASSWALEEKIGRPLALIHQPVPGLNSALAPPIGNFLRKLRPGVAFTRWNWGLSASPQLDQHPSLKLPTLTPPLTAESVWVRIEDQALVALPSSGGVLFGIRVWVVPLSKLLSDPTAARGLHRALATMPDALARYKGLTAARESLMALTA